MRDVLAFAAVLAIAAMATLLWPSEPEGARNASAGVVDTAASSSEPIQPVPAPGSLDERKVRLGEKLFHDPVLSADGTISCATCHDLKRGGADGLPRSVGIRGAVGAVNAPSVLNAALGFRQFWDGRAETLESQIDGPLQNAKEMGATWSEVVAKLDASPAYAGRFAQIYPDGITAQNVKDAIATYERWLLPRSARFDRYLMGDASAISAEEARGYELFKSYGCVSCHQGVGIGGNMFQRFGVMGDYFADRGEVVDADYGRYNVTGNEADRHVFKVPSLRNVALTAPYFHDGAAQTLPDAVRIMGRYQLGRELAPADVDLIVGFLGTLTGELPEQSG